jgi:sulfur carrier protein
MTETQLATITVNGTAQAFAHGETVTDVIATVTGRPIAPDGHAADGNRLGIAVARNATVVPRSQWSRTTLTEGDDLEIVTAVQGG